jgi:hypothetical protein
MIIIFPSRTKRRRTLFETRYYVNLSYRKKILLQNPPFILREPAQHERKNHNDIKSLPLALRSVEGLREDLSATRFKSKTISKLEAA